MPSDDLFDRDKLGFEEWSQTPKPEHLVPDAIEREQQREFFQSRLQDEPSSVIITHTDADGLSSAALVAHSTDHHTQTETLVQPIDYHGAYRFEHVVEDLRTTTLLNEIDLYVCDFALDEPVDGLRNLGVRVNTAQWFDHHQWDDDTAAAVRDAGFDLVVDEDECTASLLVSELGPFNARHEELAHVTKDIDLWIRDDPRSAKLNTFASMVDGPWEYIATVLKCGPSLPDDILNRIEQRTAEDVKLEQAAVGRAKTIFVNGIKVGVTYSRGGRSSNIGNGLVEEVPEDYDIAVVMKSHGGIGIYSHSDRTGFARCHEVARELGGGGHPTAAGCDAPVETFRELAEYWTTAGDYVISDIRQAIRIVVSGGEN